MIRERDDVKRVCTQRGIPEHMHGAVERYLFDRIEGGSFFTAVVSNNFTESVGRADDANSNALRNWAMLIYNDFPRQAHGSPKAVERWLKREDQE